MSKAKEFLGEAEVSQESILKKVEEMINDDKGWLLKKCKSLLNSGGVDPDDFGDDFRLPRILYYAALGDLRDNRKSLHPSDLKIAKDLSHY